MMKEIKLLQEQIDKMDVKDFDLNAWKQYTIILLARIFGEQTQKITQIENIEYDYSSWSLRDTSGRLSNLETCKKLGREILSASIDELKALGLPDKNQIPVKHIQVEVISTSLENELKGSQYKEIAKIVNSDINAQKKKKELQKVIKRYGSEIAESVLAEILASPELKNLL
ncbi:MAG: hypothetical protein R2764_17555 [Bacteroidales bacterium]